MSDVLVAGHICLDITPVFKSNRVANISDVLLPGKLIHVDKADIHTGGSVANTGLAMHILGANVKLAAKVGQDSFGKVIREIINQYGCPCDVIEDESVGTSYSIVLAIPGVDRIFLHDQGANDTFCSADISDAMLEGIGHFHFGYPPLMNRMFEDDGQELLTLFKRIKAKKITTSLDMAAVDANAPAGQADWREILRKVLPYVDFFVPSVEEICFMLDRRRFDAWTVRAKGGDLTRVLNVQDDIQPLADELMGMGAKVILIKCGAPGLFYQTAGPEVMTDLCDIRGLEPTEWISQVGFEASYRQEIIVSATGAGDTSIAAFLTSMLSGYSLLRCVQLAAATGACCISTYDALSGLLPLDVLWERIEQGWEKEHFI